MIVDEKRAAWREAVEVVVVVLVRWAKYRRARCGGCGRVMGLGVCRRKAASGFIFEDAFRLLCCVDSLIVEFQVRGRSWLAPFGNLPDIRSI